jgi:FkbM family methyltransferase
VGRLRTWSKGCVKLCVSSLGYEIHPSDRAHPARRARAMENHGIDLVVDVGANEGQYVSWLRAGGYKGRIISMEPDPEVFSRLEQKCRNDPQWNGRMVAVGAREGVGTLNVSDDSRCSSLLKPQEELVSRIPWAESHRTLETEVVTLDQVWEEFGASVNRLMVKMDVQGFEGEVIEGGGTALRAASLLELEMSLVELYSGGKTMFELLPRVKDLGFELMSINPGYVDRATGQVLDVDVLAFRR